MTKEEVLSKVFGYHYDNETNKDVAFSLHMKAMDEYTKQQIISFCKWMDSEGLYQRGDDEWKTLKPDCNTEWNTEEIVEQFIEQQQNK